MLHISGFEKFSRFYYRHHIRELLTLVTTFNLLASPVLTLLAENTSAHASSDHLIAQALSDLENDSSSEVAQSEIQRLLDDPTIVMDARVREFLTHIAQVVNGDLFNDDRTPKTYNLDSFPREWLFLIWNYIEPLESLGINLQSVTKEGIFYFDAKDATELQDNTDVGSLYNFPEGVVFKLKRVSRQKYLVGISLTELQKSNPELSAWFSEKINLAESFASLQYGAYYKLANGTIQSDPPADIAELVAILPLEASYDGNETVNLPLIAKDQAVQVFYKGGIPFYIAVSNSETKKDVYWSEQDKQYYVFDSGESAPPFGSAYPLENFPFFDEDVEQVIARMNERELSKIEIRCDEAGFLCTADGKQVVSWSSKLPIQQTGDVVYEVNGTKKKKLGLFKGLKELGYIGVMIDGQYKSLKYLQQIERNGGNFKDQVEVAGNSLLSEIFNLGQFSQSEVEAVKALQTLLPGVENVSDDFLLSLLATEDKRFITNGEQGFFAGDVASLLRALLSNNDEGAIVSGASTLYNQTAKNLFKTFEEARQRNLDRKLQDMQDAAILGNFMDEEKILRLYLEVLNKNGFPHLTEMWFGKSPADLNFMEGSLLAGHPQSPSLTSPTSLNNVYRLLDRHVTVLSLVAANNLRTNAELEAAHHDAQLLLLPTPTETLQWLRGQLTDFDVVAAQKISFEAGDNFMELLLQAGLLNKQQYDELIARYYDEFVWQNKLDRKPSPNRPKASSYAVMNKDNQLVVADIPYHLFGTPIEPVKNQLDQPIVTAEGNALWWDANSYQYYELTQTGQLLASDITLIQNSELGTYVTIGDYLSLDAKILVDAEFEADDVRVGSDGFAYWLSNDNKWLQLGQIVTHNTSKQEIVIPLSSAELAAISAHEQTVSVAATAISAALELTAFSDSDAPVLTEQQIIDYVRDNNFTSIDPNRGALEQRGQLLLYPQAIETMMRDLGIDGTAIETQDAAYFMDSIRSALRDAGTAVVLLGNEFAQAVPFKNVGENGATVLEVLPENYQYVVVRSIFTETQADGTTQNWVIYTDPTRRGDANGSAATVVATEIEFMELAMQMGRGALWSNKQLLDVDGFRYDYTSAQAQSALFWQTNGQGITSVDGGTVVDRESFLQEFTTLDVAFNNRVTQILKEAQARTNSKGAVAVIMDAQTGAIEVMTGINDAGEVSNVNMATVPYVPGSVAKPIALLAAGAGGVSLTDRFPAGDSYTFPGTPFRIANWSLGRDIREPKEMTGLDALIRSNNPALVNIGLATIERNGGNLNYLPEFYATFDDFAGGVAGLANEPVVALETNETIGPATMQFFGQRTQMDALTLAHWYATIANDGVIPGLTVAKDTLPGSQTSLQEIFDPAGVSNALAIVRTGLNRVTLPAGNGFLAGTAVSFGNDLEPHGITAFGKTGTAETGTNTRSNATFAGWIELPSGEKKVFVVTLLQGGEGSTHAAPVADQMMDEYVARLQQDQEIFAEAEPVLVPVLAATTEITGTAVITHELAQAVEAPTTVTLASWDQVNDYYYGRSEAGAVLFGANKETAQEVSLVNGIGYVTDENGYGAFLVPDETGYIHNILDSEYSKVPDALKDRFETITDIRNAYGQ